MRVQLGLFLIIFLLQACSGGQSEGAKTSPIKNTEAPATDQSSMRFSLSGQHYIVAFPQGGIDPARAYKLLLAFHGSGQSEQGMQSMTQLETLSDEYIVVYPKSQEVEWDEGCGCNIASRLGAKDVNFVVQLVEKMHREYNLLEGENYAVGYSQGGLFSQNMLCKHSEIFRAVVSVGAPMSEQLGRTCQISEPTHFMLVQGTADSVLPYTGSIDEHFPLLSAPEAIEVIAEQNGLDLDYTEAQYNVSVTERVYQSEQGVTNKLISIRDAEHQWSFSHYDTAKAVLDFFKEHSQYPLMTGSALYTIDSKRYHVRSLGDDTAAGDIVILPGANRFFHSDSAWAALIQPLLAKHSRVHVIDKLGSAWSSSSDTPSQASFAADLPDLLAVLEVEKVTLLSFANANLTTLMYLAEPNPDIDINGVVWVDPDVIMAHSIQLYQSGPVAELRAYPEIFLEHVAAGNWSDKSMERVAIERAEIESLIPDIYQEDMDWIYYDLVANQRTDIDKQVTRIKEMMSYHDDLETVSHLNLALSVPVSIIDGDFERHDIALASEGDRPALIKWQEEGSFWSQSLANDTGGHYYPLQNTSHQLFFEHPDTVIDAVLILH
ncbi:alpha/beta hydrolase [Pseudoalteromonas luteoviolacea]|uniref:alpha/beta hydrolase n=1 Tax=Pseudoalteromonas luteoviolacea TaxID=43657 RepID=UPI001F476EA1|nr:alpha/beta hydrolase [Pseudoalteromonas luteoviolacea]MCF6441076.1 alpha/beta hydrolase [Pseudoalteromonas luteoviolacea]